MFIKFDFIVGKFLYAYENKDINIYLLLYYVSISCQLVYY